MNKDWKTNIGEQFAERGIYRLKYLNDKILNDCSEYCNYLEEFEDLIVEIKSISSLNTYDEDSPYKVFERLVDAGGLHKIWLITINFRLNYNIALYSAPFQLGFVYTGHDGLIIKYTKLHSSRKAFKNVLTKRNGKKRGDAYVWEEEKLKEPEVLEKEYLFQLLNNRLTNFIDQTIKENS